LRFIKNPILRGFHPDPSILRVGEDYYIATSTFEWYPGVLIYHSKDLVHWKLTAAPLNRTSQLDMRGNPSSGGVWAPYLGYHDGIYYLLYTDVKTLYTNTKDMHNCLVTSDDICEDWSEPIYLHSLGFDPYLFKDDDGKMWVLSMIWDHRKNKNRFGGIIIQEYSKEQKKMIGPVYNIFNPPHYNLVEGPRLFKRNSFYYLMLAQGGTDIEHSVIIARSKSLFGPYEEYPKNPVLTSRDDATLPLQKAGHGDLVETQNGEWYMVHLAARPVPRVGRFPLGRETCIQKVEWTEDGWIRLVGGGNKPEVYVPAPNLPEYKFEEQATKDHFDSDKLSLCYQTLRIPLSEEYLTLKERPGYLRLRGSESLSSKHHQTLIARRQQSFKFYATTCVEFEPKNFKQMAGLVYFYDVENFYYLYITYDEEIGKQLNIMVCDNNKFDEPLDQKIDLNGVDRCYLRVKVNYDRMQFYYSLDENEWIKVGPIFDASKLSGEYCREGWFTGAMIGLCCQDLTCQKIHADFDYFEYVEFE